MLLDTDCVFLQCSVDRSLMDQAVPESTMSAANTTLCHYKLSIDAQRINQLCVNDASRWELIIRSQKNLGLYVREIQNRS